MKGSVEPEEKCVPVEILIEMKVSALGILERIKSGDAGEVQDAILLASVADEDAPKIREQLRQIKLDNPQAGVRGFLLPIEDEI